MNGRLTLCRVRFGILFLACLPSHHHKHAPPFRLRTASSSSIRAAPRTESTASTTPFEKEVKRVSAGLGRDLWRSVKKQSAGGGFWERKSSVWSRRSQALPSGNDGPGERVGSATLETFFAPRWDQKRTYVHIYLRPRRVLADLHTTLSKSLAPPPKAMDSVRVTLGELSPPASSSRLRRRTLVRAALPVVLMRGLA